MRTTDPVHRQGLLAMLSRRLGGAWSAASTRPQVLEVITQSLGDPVLRRQGIALAAATRDVRHRPSLERLAEDATVPEEVRVAAIEGLGSFPGGTDPVFDRLIESVKGKRSSSATAEAAIRTIARLHDVRGRLADLATSNDYPLGLRREALQTLVQLQDGGSRVLAIARAGKLPADLKTDATTWLHSDSDRRIRAQAAEILPLPRTAAGQSLPPIRELVRRHGDVERGRTVFFRPGTNSCAGCHRVQGRGQWVGPDLSTIGVKYGRDELIRSILSPSAAIGYSFRSLVLALADGRVITGLPVEETPNRLVIKTAEGQRASLEPRTIEDRRNSDVSLMPEGLAQTLTVQEFVDLLEYLTTLRRPVSLLLASTSQSAQCMSRTERLWLIRRPGWTWTHRSMTGTARGFRGEDLRQPPKARPILLPWPVAIPRGSLMPSFRWFRPSVNKRGWSSIRRRRSLPGSTVNLYPFLPGARTRTSRRPQASICLRA